MLTAATSPPAVPDGWVADLLQWTGVDPTTAHHIQTVLLRPLAILFVVVVAAVALWLGNRTIKHWIGGAARKAAGRADSPRAVARATTLTVLLSSIWRVVVLVIAFFVILGTLGLDLTPLLAGATVVGATIGFGAQSVVRDLLAGFLLISEGQYDIGDTLVVGDTTGTVEDLSLRVTRLRGPDGSMWFVPNGEIRKLSNVTRGWAQVSVDAVVPAGVDVDVVLDAVRGAADALAAGELGGELLRPPEVLGIVAADAETITARVGVRVASGRRDAIERHLRGEMARRLRAAGVFALPPPAPPSVPSSAPSAPAPAPTPSPDPGR